MIKRSSVRFVQAVLVAILLTACSGPLAAGSSQIILPEPEDFAALQGVAARGQSLYQSTCAVCHGREARGIAGLGKDLTDSAFIEDMSDAEVIVFLTNGRRSSDPLNETGLEMPPKGGNPALTDQDLADIVAYIRTLSE
jgi:disulfide bond formation protein DsbB